MFRRRWFWVTILLTLFAVLGTMLETRCIISGWLRGEVFYHGYPTSFWRRVIVESYRNAIPVQLPGKGNGVIQTFIVGARPMAVVDWLLLKAGVSPDALSSAFPADFLEPKLDVLLAELAQDDDAEVRQLALSWQESLASLKAIHAEENR